MNRIDIISLYAIKIESTRFEIKKPNQIKPFKVGLV